MRVVSERTIVTVEAQQRALRPCSSIWRDVESQHQRVKLLLNLAADFYAVQTYTMEVVDGQIQPRPDPLPVSLRELLTTEQESLAVLVAELHEARRTPSSFGWAAL